MSFDVNWDIDSYREDHESDEHWDLRKTFMERWKNDYCEERLVCLARVFANVELLGCRYPTEVMQEVSRLSHDVANKYRDSRKDKLKRTFVSASDAAEDRAKGVKREGGLIVGGPAPKSTKIEFVRPGTVTIDSDSDEDKKPKKKQLNDNDTQNENGIKETTQNVIEERKVSELTNYLEEMEQMECIDIRYFNDRMFYNSYGRMVLLIRPWTSKLGNIQSSCQACNMNLSNSYSDGVFTLTINNQVLARAQGSSRAEAKNVAEILAWNRLREESVSVLVKEQFIAQNDSRITMNDVTGKRKNDEFGTPVENSVAAKMMKLMGWKGGGLGADAQGIAEPIKPHLQMVNRAGLGSQCSDIRALRRAAQSLMQRYIAADTLDVDLVFTNEFTKDERAALHQVAQRAGLASKSYGSDNERFLVVKKKLDPFSLVRAVIEKGGNTPKYQVFIPASIRR